MFEVEELTLAHGNGPYIFNGLCVTLGPEPVALMGPSGSGKTTFLNVLTGLQRHTGRVRLNGVDLGRASERGRRVASVFQDYRLVEFLSIAENVQLGAESRGRRLSSRGAAELLELVGLGNLSPARLPGAVSGGEQQRVAIARALAARCDALIADEPTGALDRVTTASVTETLLATCTERGVQLVVATHDLAVASRFPTILSIDGGQLLPLPGSLTGDLRSGEG